MRSWTPMAWWLLIGVVFIVAVLAGAYVNGAGRDCTVVTDGPVWTETCVRDVSP